MLKIKSSNKDSTEDFIKLSNIIGENVYGEKSHIFSDLNDLYGKGTVTAIRISPTITNLIIEGAFHEDFVVTFEGNKRRCIDFVYCLEGYVNHKFKKTTPYQRINFRQNSILSRPEKSKSVFRFPGKVPLKISIITIQPTALMTTKTQTIQEKAFTALSNTYFQDYYRYFGRVCFKTAVFVNDAVKHSFNSSSNLFFKEAAILNILASQIERHDEDSKGDINDAPLRQSEIDKIIALENFICNNLSEDLSVNRLVALSGLNAVKLQKGFHYLFNNTISCYIKEKRLEKAASLIKETELNVSELVYSVGFSSRSYFTKIFKQRYGVLPSQCVSNPNLLLAV